MYLFAFSFILLHFIAFVFYVVRVALIVCFLRVGCAFCVLCLSFIVVNVVIDLVLCLFTSVFRFLFSFSVYWLCTQKTKQLNGFHWSYLNFNLIRRGLWPQGV